MFYFYLKMHQNVIVFDGGALPGHSRPPTWIKGDGGNEGKEGGFGWLSE